VEPISCQRDKGKVKIDNNMNEALDILTKVGAVIENDHFVGTSGDHMSVYVNKDYLLPHTAETARITQIMAEANADLDIDVVAAPVVGGAILGNWVAYHLSKLKGKEVLSAYADKTEEGPLVFKRGYDALIKNKKVLIIDDTVATGLSVDKMVDVVKRFGGDIKRLSVFVNRVPEAVNEKTLGIPFFSLCEIPAETYAPENCPLCKNNIPVNIKIGHGKKYLEEKNV